ncbi:dynein axonemal assembly factor 3 [Ambystoma mexicanum]|uniref:dynein axonemal assembly factor 3 n=1 Tax=Ambystoma mexicanum TaxID=8296 RepID=UPI0037E9A649
MTATGTGEGFGALTWWGFSPALDLQMKCLGSSMEHMNLSEDGTPELNILLVGSGDCRHLLKTICQAHRWPPRRLKFYIVENNCELLARQLLFLTLALESPQQMGLQEKSEAFLELLGNSLIRNQTAAYLQEKANLFIEYITDLELQQRKVPLLDLTALKFKERDQLEGIFKFWRNPDPKIFQIDKMWDLRNRQYLGTRYDSRKGAYDWDLSMKLYDREVSVLNKQEYYRWREKGVAFELRDGIYDIPNKSLASGLLLKLKGEKIPARGYWGDVATGPFITFGIETEAQSLLKKANGVHTKSAQDISLHNITALFHELTTNTRYNPTPVEDEHPLCQITEVEEAAEEVEEESKHPSDKEGTTCGSEIPLASPEKPGEMSKDEDFDSLCPKNVRVHFLPLSCVRDLHLKSKYQKLFNLIYFSCSMVHQLTPELKLICAPKATLLLELTKYMVDLRKEQLSNFSTRVTELATEAGFAAFGTVDGERDAFARYELQEEPRPSAEVHS